MNQKKALEEKDNDYSRLEEEYTKVNNVDLLDPFLPPAESVSAKDLTATIVIAARNAKSSIFPCLVSIEQSSFNLQHPNDLQVIVVDDGSTDATWEVIKNNSFALHLTAIKQKHFGQAQALNTGISVAENQIIICCDADMVLSYYAIEHFINRHHQFPNILLAGFRSDISENSPLVNPQYIREHGPQQYSPFVHDERIVFPIPGFPDNMCLTSNHYKSLGHLRGLWMRKNHDPWLLSDLVFGALFSLPKSTYDEIGGYDERLIGYGCTDGYLASKAISVGALVVPVYAASGLHISHSARTENKSLEYENNRRLFYTFLESSETNNYPNWLIHAKNRIIESYTQKSITMHTRKHTVNDARPTHYQVDALLAIGKFKESLKILPKNETKNTNDVQLRRAKAYVGLHNYHEAIECFKRVASTLPEVAISVARAQAAIGQYKLAHKTLTTFAEENPKSPSLMFWNNQSIQHHITQGKNYLHQEFYTTALQCFENALIYEPDNNTALTYIKKIQKFMLSTEFSMPTGRLS